jgi:hypothetical protein
VLVACGARLCTELIPLVLDDVVMAVFPKLDMYSSPGRGHAVATAVRGWSVAWLWLGWAVCELSIFKHGIIDQLVH